MYCDLKENGLFDCSTSRNHSGKRIPQCAEAVGQVVTKKTRGGISHFRTGHECQRSRQVVSAHSCGRAKGFHLLRGSSSNSEGQGCIQEGLLFFGGGLTDGLRPEDSENLELGMERIIEGTSREEPRDTPSTLQLC